MLAGKVLPLVGSGLVRVMVVSSATTCWTQVGVDGLVATVKLVSPE